MKRKILLVFFTLLTSSYFVALVAAQGGFPTDNDVNDIAKKLYCPVCPNTPLDVCETKACQDWRAEIKTQLASGWSESQIVDYFVHQYGERVLAEPERSGFTSLVWLLPVIATLLGLSVVIQALKSWRAGRQEDPATSLLQPAVSPEILAQIERELRDLA